MKNIQIKISNSNDFWKVYYILIKYFRCMGIRDEYYANQYCIYFYRTINMFTSFTKIQEHRTDCINISASEFVEAYEKYMITEIKF